MGKPKLPWFPLYVYDWITDEAVQCMTLEQQGAYLRLLMHQWIEGSIPRDETEIARLLHIDRDSVASLMAPVWQKFPKVKYKRGRYANRTLESIREEQQSRRKVLSDSGLKGARRRWGGDSHPKENDSHPNAGPMPTRAITITKTKTETENQSQNSSSSGAGHPGGHSDSDLARAKALRRYEAGMVAVMGSGSQGEADRTVISDWFENWIWPMGSNGIGPQRMKIVERLVRSARLKNRPMAWLTVRVNKEFNP